MKKYCVSFTLLKFQLAVLLLCFLSACTQAYDVVKDQAVAQTDNTTGKDPQVDTCANGAINYPSCNLAAETKSKTFKVSSTETQDIYKILLIIDNSASMKSSMDKLNNALNLLYAKFAGKKLQIYVRQMGMGPVSKSGAFWTGDGAYTRDIRPYVDSIGFDNKIEYLSSFVTMEIAYPSFLLDPESPNYSQALDALKKNINSLQSSNSAGYYPQELFLAPLAAALSMDDNLKLYPSELLNDFPVKRYTEPQFNADDRVGVILITDENDDSRGEDFIAMKSSTVSYIKTNITQYYWSFFNGFAMSDGVSTGKEALWQSFKETNLPLGPCPSSLVKELESNWASTQASTLKSNFRTDSCIVRSTYKTVDYHASDKNDYILSSSTYETLSREVLKYSREKFRNFFMSLIINKNKDCSMVGDQKIGERYLELEKIAPDTVKTFSICSETYDSVVESLTNNITQVINNKFDLKEISTNKVTAVILHRGADSITLDINKYVLSNNNLEILEPLLKNDLIEVRY